METVNKALATKIPVLDITVKDALVIAAISLATAYALNNFAPSAVKKAIA